MKKESKKQLVPTTSIQADEQLHRQQFNKLIKERRYRLKFTEADEFIKVTNRFSGNELKFFILIFCIRQPGETRIIIPFNDMVKVLVGDKKIGSNYRKSYQKVIDNIVSNSKYSVDFPATRLLNWKERGFSENSTVHLSGHFIMKAVHEVETNMVEIMLDPDFLPLFDNVSPPYTWIFLEQIIRLSHKYSPRFYQWARMHLKDQKEVTYTWYLNSDSESSPGLRQWLNIPATKYKQWRDLNRNVIEPAVKDINENVDDLHVQYVPLKNTRGNNHAVYALQITILSGPDTSARLLASQKEAKSHARKLDLSKLDPKVQEIFQSPPQNSDELYRKQQQLLLQLAANRLNAEQVNVLLKKLEADCNKEIKKRIDHLNDE
jgi:plasmid replication initiation protein